MKLPDIRSSLERAYQLQETEPQLLAPKLRFLLSLWGDEELMAKFEAGHSFRIEYGDGVTHYFHKSSVVIAPAEPEKVTQEFLNGSELHIHGDTQFHSTTPVVDLGALDDVDSLAEARVITDDPEMLEAFLETNPLPSTILVPDDEADELRVKLNQALEDNRLLLGIIADIDWFGRIEARPDQIGIVQTINRAREYLGKNDKSRWAPWKPAKKSRFDRLRDKWDRA